jgi:hypothetical protein
VALLDKENNYLLYSSYGNYYNDVQVQYYLEAGKTYTVEVIWCYAGCAGNMTFIFTQTVDQPEAEPEQGEVAPEDGEADLPMIDIEGPSINYDPNDNDYTIVY